MSYYFYILRCSDNSLYCGQTNNLIRRRQEHNFSKKRSAKYLRGRTPAKLVYSEVFETRQQAMQREFEVKKLTKSAKEKLINDFSNDQFVEKVV
jgi:putative endonuclease